MGEALRSRVGHGLECRACLLRSRSLLVRRSASLKLWLLLRGKRKARDIGSAAFEQKSEELESDWERFVQIQLNAEAVDLAKVVARRLFLRGRMLSIWHRR